MKECQKDLGRSLEKVKKIYTPKEKGRKQQKNLGKTLDLAAREKEN